MVRYMWRLPAQEGCPLTPCPVLLPCAMPAHAHACLSAPLSACPKCIGSGKEGGRESRGKGVCHVLKVHIRELFSTLGRREESSMVRHLRKNIGNRKRERSRAEKEQVICVRRNVTGT